MPPQLESCRREKDAVDRSSFAGMALAHSDASAELRSRLEVADRQIEELKVYKHSLFLCDLKNEYTTELFSSAMVARYSLVEPYLSRHGGTSCSRKDHQRTKRRGRGRFIDCFSSTTTSHRHSGLETHQMEHLCFVRHNPNHSRAVFFFTFSTLQPVQSLAIIGSIYNVTIWSQYFVFSVGSFLVSR